MKSTDLLRLGETPSPHPPPQSPCSVSTTAFFLSLPVCVWHLSTHGNRSGSGIIFLFGAERVILPQAAFLPMKGLKYLNYANTCRQMKNQTACQISGKQLRENSFSNSPHTHDQYTNRT